MENMETGAIFQRHFQCLLRGSDTGFPAPDQRVGRERHLFSPARLRLGEVGFDDSLVLAVNQDHFLPDPEEIAQRGIAVDEHIPRGRPHENFDSSEVRASVQG